MALKTAGVRLVAEGYQQYISQIQQVNKAHAQAFQTKPAQAFDQQARKTAKSTGILADVMGGLGLKTMAFGAVLAAATLKAAKFASEP